MPRNNSKERRAQRQASAAERQEHYNSLNEAQKMAQRIRNHGLYLQKQVSKGE